MLRIGIQNRDKLKKRRKHRSEFSKIKKAAFSRNWKIYYGASAALYQS